MKTYIVFAQFKITENKKQNKVCVLFAIGNIERNTKDMKYERRYDIRTGKWLQVCNHIQSHGSDSLVYL